MRLTGAADASREREREGVRERRSGSALYRPSDGRRVQASAVYGLLVRAAVKKAADQRTTAQRSSVHAPGFLFCRLPSCRVCVCPGVARCAPVPRLRPRAAVCAPFAATGRLRRRRRCSVARVSLCRERKRERVREGSVTAARSWPRFVSLLYVPPIFSTACVCVFVPGVVQFESCSRNSFNSS